MCVYIYMCVCVYIHTYIIRVCIHTHTHTLYIYIVILGPVFPKKKEKRHLRMALVYSIMAFQDRRQHLAEQIFP